ncbi:MAG: arsenate reductase ArsC [Leptospiraceae bacterium]|nr:arsenate reductase ArsC [Leptospiraceae bacterium]
MGALIVEFRMTNRLNVLFLCTGNSCRSQMAEGIMNTFHHNRFQAFSAGSAPDLSRYPETRGVHPGAIDIMRKNNVHVQHLHAKSWDAFLNHADHIQFVFTLCDSAREEMIDTCPVFPGQPLSAHWGVPDPAAATGGAEEIERVFKEVFLMLRRRIELFAALPLHTLQDHALQSSLDDIGRSS